MNDIDQRLLDIEQDVKLFDQMSLTLSNYWDGDLAEQFDREFSSAIDYRWNDYYSQASRCAEDLQSLEKDLKELSEEIDSDYRVFRRTYY